LLVHVFEIQYVFSEQGTEFLNIISMNLMAEWCKVEMKGRIYAWLQIPLLVIIMKVISGTCDRKQNVVCMPADALVMKISRL
jgi:hypothetical protein